MYEPGLKKKKGKIYLGKKIGKMLILSGFQMIIEMIINILGYGKGIVVFRQTSIFRGAC